jgi:hypothetical protein
VNISYFRKVDDMKRRAYVTHAVLTSKFLGPGSIGGITDTIKKVPRNQEAKKDPNLKHNGKHRVRNRSPMHARKFNNHQKN